MGLPAVDSKVNDNLRFQSNQWPPAGTRKVTIDLTNGAGARSIH